MNLNLANLSPLSAMQDCRGYDPGEDLVKQAKLLGRKHYLYPGPKALTALVSSGLPASRFAFWFSLKRKKKEKILRDYPL